MPQRVNDEARRESAAPFRVRGDLLARYPDVYTQEALEALAALSAFNGPQKDLMRARIERRARRLEVKEHISFLDDDRVIPGTDITVADARAGRFVSEIANATAAIGQGGVELKTQPSIRWLRIAKVCVGQDGIPKRQPVTLRRIADRLKVLEVPCGHRTVVH